MEAFAPTNSSTAAAVTFITFVQDLKKKSKAWGPMIELCASGEKTLERFRYQFPDDWLYSDQLRGEWSAYNEILKRKNDSIQEQLAGLQLKIVAEDKIVENKINDIILEWEQTRPVQGNLRADTAMNTINVFDGKLNRVQEEYDLVCRAKEALDLELVRHTRLEPVFEELRDLKAVWTALSGIWSQINELREILWATVQPRKLRQQIDGLLSSTKDMPTRMRQYAAFEYVQDVLKGLLKSNMIISELKSEALKDRHWKQVFKVLRLPAQITLSLMTLGNVYDMDLKRNETTIKEVILQAQGEMALEEYIKQVKETWTSYTLDLVNYQNKCRLIRGWDDLFTKCSENLNSLSAMKLSPYYKVFEEEASSWEEKLNRVHVLFDVWIDVQRQWVYLEGIFSGSADIKHLLPVESSRFQNINTEFLTVMKKVYKSPFVIDVMNIPGIQKSLERLADLLSKIQKALGEYLERERSSFPRFYFVGDEDLLEIIGNSKDILRIMKHLKKMFAGISTIMLDEDLTQIQGMASREGEEIRFPEPIMLKDYPKINDWLARLEGMMRLSLATLLTEAVTELQSFYGSGIKVEVDQLMSWLERYPAQLVTLAIQIAWTSSVETSLEAAQPPEGALNTIHHALDLLADIVLQELSPVTRRKCEHLITELVHERDVTRNLIQRKLLDAKAFGWLYQMRFYLDKNIENPLERLLIHVADAAFPYGWEYLGVPDRLVQTPLTDRVYMTLTQALDTQLGGAPFGPAGTGKYCKTESVKALGVQLGRFVLVFCCDETFDFQAMGRIFVGLCQVGAWGCFDEFNRLEERILSAVSQQVQTIQQGLSNLVKNPSTEIELVGKSLKLNKNMGIFITTNPNYAGRSQLPPNLTKLFRPMAMTRPDRELIAQVMLFSQGFRTAESLASKIVPFFNLCDEQLSPQPHYDFGLRALKAVLASAGILKRERLQSSINADTDVPVLSDAISEQIILIQSVTETIVPKLVADDVPLLTSLLADVFPGVDYMPVDLETLREQILKVCGERRLVHGERWIAKILQLYQIQKIQHGLMMVGPSGTGKTNAWQVLLAALERLDGIEGVAYVIDPKAMHKDALYGTLDPTTREWTDGLFTHVLRKIVDDVRGESGKRHWIIFDGDVDPEWVENLNSVLDDNKLLTLPNGERLNLPPNVRIMFEVEHLRYATLATVSRCGMIWFSDDIIEPSMVYRNYLSTLETVPLDADDDDSGDFPLRRADGPESTSSAHLETQKTVAAILESYFADDDLVSSALAFAESIEHIMDFTITRALNTLFSLLNKTVRNIIEYNNQHPDFPLNLERVEQYVTKRLLVALVWAFSGDAKLDLRAEMGEFLRKHTGIDLPPFGPGTSLIDFDVQVSSGEWIAWQSRVPVIEIEPHSVTASDVVVPTVDTIRHEDVLYSWLTEHKPLLLCGPPGSGKTMTLFSALRKLPDMEVVGLNFSSATTPELIMKTFEQYCEFRKTPNGVILSPVQIGRWLIIFCDEINLPATDKYGTQRVISFIRQLVECGGYWRTSDMAWVKLERIQFVGACNPPTDPGRVPLNHRFLRHAPLVMVDYPGEISLKQIYGTYNRAVLKVVPNLRAYPEPLTDAMVDFYLASQKHFTTDTQAHYVYSPRELTRWVRGIYEAIRPLEVLSVEGLVRVWAHEALRLFQDRLVTEEERAWTDERIDMVALEHFPTIDQDEALGRPILFSNWTSKNYVPVDREVLREYTKARLRVFYEEELDVPLVLFNDVLDHVLRIDRVFRQVQGHLLLIGVSGSGKTTLSRFVAWMNGLSIFQIKVSNKYTGEDFDDDLRTVLRRAGCKGEKICFIMDESNVLDSGFLERMNTLLANAEVPGLFEGDEHAALMTACKEGSQRDGLMLDSPEELYRWFTQQVAKNLHVVFTMNPPENGLASRAATSPALFNRCVLDWFGDWSDQAFFQVGMEFTQSLDLDLQSYSPPLHFPLAYRGLVMPPLHRTAVVNALVHVHTSLHQINQRLSRRQGRYNYVTPRHYLDFINQYVRLYTEKRDELEEQQRHLHVGLDKLKDTVTQVEELRKSLASKRSQLEAKNAEANEKLKRMVADQQEAEQKKAVSIEIQAALVEQDRTIQQRRQVVMADLADAEPAVLEAQSAVSNIKRQHLQEVRSMANPPEAVKLAMESVCTLLGHKLEGWRSVQGIIRRDDFIQRIVNFDTTQMTKQLRELMKKDFLSRPSYNFETVQRASRACGPLVKWAIAQVRFSEILDKVEPLRNEVQSLETQAETTKKQAKETIKMIAELEAKIATYKDEYALLISETQMIKSEMERVQGKVDRSMRLLESLSSERGRWEAGSRTFDVEMSTIVGDVLLSAAFLAYGGFFDQHYREVMWQEWGSHLTEANIKFKPEISFTEYLSTADDRLSWQSKSLPSDNLTTENAIMLKRFNRYPLIIDPTGQATSFLLNEYKERKITVTSFLDEAFLKVLESALRFGNPLLIQDVEHLDPILNAVLNKEIRRTGGRVLIRLGSQDIDFSPSFTMFLSTRDPSVEFSPDICSRVTFVNFTMTRSSLQSQALDQVLKVERPDTERKRTDLMKVQGEFKLRLRTLEKLLLQALNESTGNILDDDKVIDTLETLKREAAEITRKVEETDVVMKEVEQVTTEYLPIAQACSSVFFILEQLNLVNHFYQFSLQFFLDIFDYVLHHNPNLKNVSDQHRRREILLNDLFLIAYKRTARALLHRDHLMLAVLLSQVKLRGLEEINDELEFLLESGDRVVVVSNASTNEENAVLSPDQLQRLEAYSRHPQFKPVQQHFKEHQDQWVPFLSSDAPELCIPRPWEANTAVLEAIRTVLIIKCFRPDRLLQAITLYVKTVFEADLSVEASYDLNMIVANEISCSTPVALVSVTGYDASYRVEHLIKLTGARSTSVAMGSQEGFTLADQAIAAASRQGTWVLLKNVHLAPSWLGQLEKKLQTLNAHRNFRLFITMEANPSIPVNILRQSRLFMNEPPPGIKANMLDSLRSIPSSRLTQGPAEKIRLYFLLTWFHAVIQERLRYVPLGWTKTYDFNDSDLAAAFGTIDNWLNRVGKGRANIDPANIPWDALRTLIKQSVYGGRIDSDFDQRLLDSFVDALFTPEAYNVYFDLVPNTGGTQVLNAPDGTKLERFMTWVQALPDREPPAWLSLPPTAERVIAIAQGNALLGNLRRMRMLADDDDETVTPTKTKSQPVQQPSWMRALHERCGEWLERLPAKFNTLPKATQDNQDPLYRLFAREGTVGGKLLDQVRKDLADVVQVCQGELKQTNHLRALMSALTKGTIPNHWRRYKVPKAMAVAEWIANLARRLAQLDTIAGLENLSNVEVWLGGLFFPEAYVTATRQAVAHRKRWSLETLHLRLDIERVNDPGAYIIEGLVLEGASWGNDRMSLNNGESVRLNSSQIRWVQADESQENLVNLPVYLNNDRNDVLFTVGLPFDGSASALVAMRAVCLTAGG
ncbi:hypothetical protein M378DRAFT_94916 [Amanita muscaria Koide BX008]|uniref:Dynein heavy chain, cytoplasmic n=1 Tax=Amanita muscaria (strain Koide BX008) TaxID=946122 RepID=A0A0C2X898_AMAMK|nr:hypothetical protein M378DRAFT_94916 [Amanita muscaria Koide BX008]